MKSTIAILVLFCLLTSCNKDKDNCLNDSPWYQDKTVLTYESLKPGLANNIHLFVTRIDKSSVSTIDDIGAFVPIGNLRICGSKMYKDEQVLYDLDANVGDHWTYSSSGILATREKFTLKTKNVSVTVPYGTFDATVFEIEGERSYPFRYDFYVTKDHGPVKLVGNEGDWEIDLELEDRHLRN